MKEKRNLYQKKTMGDAIKKQEWQQMERDYPKEGLPVIKLTYADILARPLFYPDNYFAHGLAVLMRRKAFTKEEIELLRTMGFTVEIGIRKVTVPEGF